MYRAAADEQVNHRGARHRSGDAVEGIASNAGGTDAALLEEFAETQRVACPSCAQPVRFVRYYPAGEAGQFRVDFACPKCNRPVAVTFEGDTLVRWLMWTD